MRKFKRRVLEDPEPELELDEDELDDEADDEEDEEEGELEEEDEEEEFDEEEDEEDEEEEDWTPPSRRPAFRRSRAFAYDDEDEELTEEMAAAIRAGLYVPKRADPWTAHILYNALKDTGRL